MKALVYHGPGQRAWEFVPNPVIREPTDALVRIDSTTITKAELDILQGEVPEVKPGTILGHEAVGTVVEVGSAVTGLALGDRVLVSRSDGLQADLACVPHADTSVRKVSQELSDDQALARAAAHHFPLDEIEKAYDVYAAAIDAQALDVVLTATPTGPELVKAAAVSSSRLTTPREIAHTCSQSLVEQARARWAGGQTVSWLRQLDAAFAEFRRNGDVGGMHELLRELTDERIAHLMKPDRVQAAELKSAIATAVGDRRAAA